jgi:hypothetical protein
VVVYRKPNPLSSIIQDVPSGYLRSCEISNGPDASRSILFSPDCEFTNVVICQVFRSGSCPRVRYSSKPRSLPWDWILRSPLQVSFGARFVHFATQLRVYADYSLRRRWDRHEGVPIRPREYVITFWGVFECATGSSTTVSAGE